jgi:hypothetical protein
MVFSGMAPTDIIPGLIGEAGQRQECQTGVLVFPRTAFKPDINYTSFTSKVWRKWMRHIMSLKARRELLTATAKRYQQACKQEKTTILDEFTAATGYHRKYAILLLKNYTPQNGSSPPKKRIRNRKYSQEVQATLVLIWEATSRICSKRLVPFIPEMVAAMERHGHLSLSAEVREQLLSISSATVDRLLFPIRRGEKPTGLGTTKPGELLKKQIAIRTFTEWDDGEPGFMEADLVAHCGNYAGGSFLHTLVLTDVATGWTEFEALLFRGQEMVLQAIHRIRADIPFSLLGLDTDNGSEFINYALLYYCQEEKITFTRCRPYKKNDQCFVEQKNGAIIRRFVGYDRFTGILPCRALQALYQHLRLYVNFFQPSVKLISKTRQGSQVYRKYDQAQTPYQRILADDSISSATKLKLTKQFESLDPLDLKHQIHTTQEQLWQYADLHSLRPPKPPPVQLDALFQTHEQKTKSEPSILENKLTPLERFYRRTKRKITHSEPRYWRTRKDPFAEVWQVVEQQLQLTPQISAKAIFLALQQKYPGKFADGQLRTLQRRVRSWRLEQVDGIDIQENKESVKLLEERR